MSLLVSYQLLLAHGTKWEVKCLGMLPFTCSGIQRLALVPLYWRICVLSRANEMMLQLLHCVFFTPNRSQNFIIGWRTSHNIALNYFKVKNMQRKFLGLTTDNSGTLNTGGQSSSQPSPPSSRILYTCTHQTTTGLFLVLYRNLRIVTKSKLDVTYQYVVTKNQIQQFMVSMRQKKRRPG